MILEFNGLPGCGKSTITQELYKAAFERGLRVVNYSRGYASNGVLRKVQWIYRMVLSYIHLGRKVCAEFIVLGKTTKAPIKYVWDVIINLDRVLQCKKADVVLVDQGLVQGILSLMYTESVKKVTDAEIEKITDLCGQYLQKCCTVNCYATQEVCYERTKIRKQMGYQDSSRAENGESVAYRKQEQQLEYIRRIMDCKVKNVIKIDTMQEISENVDILLKFIDEEV